MPTRSRSRNDRAPRDALRLLGLSSMAAAMPHRSAAAVPEPDRAILPGQPASFAADIDLALTAAPGYRLTPAGGQIEVFPLAGDPCTPWPEAHVGFRNQLGEPSIVLWSGASTSRRLGR